MNPYHFVPLGPPGQRRKVKTHESFEGESGSLTCQLTTRTHLFTAAPHSERGGGHQNLKCVRGKDGKPLIPGSSLKGVVRSVAEALSGACLTLPAKLDYGKGVSYKLPTGFERCDPKERLCPACRIFGGMNRGSTFLGKINIGDALAEGEVAIERLTLESLMQPKPRHRVWYGASPQQPNVMRGRKFYYHRPGGARTTTQGRHNKTVEAVKPRTDFAFSVDYTNLEDDELALLIFALVLEPEMCHKIGMGKPVGLGSARIEVTQWEQHNLQARYEHLGKGTRVLQADALTDEIKRWTNRYGELYTKWKDSLDHLRRIWRWDPNATADIKYPTQQWFSQNRRAAIEEAP